MSETIPITTITVGERRREDLGDIAGLAASIKRYGLLHPIVVDDESALIAGERRLRACESLEWNEIEVKRLRDTTEAERREIELEENLRRKDLTPYELSKGRVELVRAAKVVIQEGKASLETQESLVSPFDGNEFRPDSGRNSRGRPSESGSYRDVEERTGISRSTASDATRHVETAETYPAMQSPEWKQYHVLQACEQLEKLPETERPQAVALLDELHPKTAVELLAKMAGKPEDERHEIYRLHESEDQRERDLAMTKAAELPPMPDPRLQPLREMQRTMRRWLKDYPDDAVNEQIGDALSALVTLQRVIQGKDFAHGEDSQSGDPG